ncbi:Unknown protein, partial [Striga hermonthica]
MRLCRPTVHVDTSPLKFNPCDLLFSEDLFDDPIAAAGLPCFLSSQSNPSVVDPFDLSYRNRFLLQHPTDSLDLPGLLVLPQSFGLKSKQKDRGYCFWIHSPVESVRVGGRYDFIVEHDVKELGAHTLVCTALYTDGGNERKYLPQFFKFVVSNPISVRTKVLFIIRYPCHDTTFLKACLENHTKSHLYIDQVEFEPAQHWVATVLKAPDNSFDHNPLA